MKKFAKLFTAVIVLAAASFSAWALDARIVSVNGKVEIQNGGSAWKAAKSGDVLKKGTTISTGFKSSATIKIDDTVVKLDSMTRVTIEKLASNSSKTQSDLYLNNGKVTADVKKTAGKKVDFKVSSAASTASVRGTSFTFYANGTIKTTSGLVSKGPGKKVPQIAVSDEADEFIPEDGESNALTETKDVSGAREIPVSEGQTSTTDQLSGIHSSPQEENSRKRNPDFGHGTESISEREHGTSLAPEKTTEDPAQKTTKDGTLEINIRIGNGE